MPDYLLCLLVVHARYDVLAILVDILRTSQLGPSHRPPAFKDDPEINTFVCTLFRDSAEKCPFR